MNSSGGHNNASMSSSVCQKLNSLSLASSEEVKAAAVHPSVQKSVSCFLVTQNEVLQMIFFLLSFQFQGDRCFIPADRRKDEGPSTRKKGDLYEKREVENNNQRETECP